MQPQINQQINFFSSADHLIKSYQTEEKKETPSSAVYVTTGAPVPDGFNAVVPIENIEKLEESKIRIEGSVKAE